MAIRKFKITYVAHIFLLSSADDNGSNINNQEENYNINSHLNQFLGPEDNRS